ncbi:hypothetical protein R3I93_011044 [Phoxinus phoxinus]|uniref:Uncharacterized protein n=1 Tax=Phoxinus phoxinus TaxID=58324 RepID=A0AAN9D370_9TELE
MSVSLTAIQHMESGREELASEIVWVLKYSELYTHCVVAGERGCVGNARALYSSSRGNSSQGRTLDNRKNTRTEHAV